MLSTGRDTDKGVNNKDSSNRVYSEGPIKQIAREPVMEWSVRVPVREPLARVLIEHTEKASLMQWLVSTQ